MDKENEQILRNRIPLGTAGLMVGTAALVDSLQFLSNIAIIGLVLSSLISLLAWFTFYIWFKFRGVGFIDTFSKFGLRMALAAAAAFIEIVGVAINALPGWTFSVLLMVSAVRAEDLIFNKTGREVTINKNAIRKLQEADLRKYYREVRETYAAYEQLEARRAGATIEDNA